MIVTLLAKEIRHHRRTALVTLLLSVAFLSTLVTYFVIRDTSSLLQIGAVAAQFLAPVYAVLAARRLFVLERRAGTWEFLSALPVSPALIVFSKLLVGAVFTIGLSVSYLLLIAVAIHRRELITGEWLLMMTCQVGAYAAAWFAVAAFFAQLGRHRVVAWGALLILFAVALDYDTRLLRELTWLDAVWLPIDHTRFAPPIGATVRAALWAIVAGALAVAVARLGDGLVVQRWYRPMTGRQRSMSIAWIVGLSTLLTVVTTGAKKVPSYDPLPLVGRIRVAGDPGSSIYQLAQALDEELTALAEPLDIPEWPSIVLLEQSRKLPGISAQCYRTGNVLTLYVDKDASPPELLRQSLQRLLIARTGYLAVANETQSWIASGFPQAWLRRRNRSPITSDARAGWASLQGVTASQLDTFWDLELRVGSEVADAIAWVGVEVVATEAGDEAMFALARQIVGGWQPDSGFGLLLRRLDDGVEPIETHVGRPWSEFTAQWVEALRAFERSAHSAEVQGRAVRVSTSSAAIALSWSRTSTHAEQLWFATMPALAAIPNPASDYDTEALDASDGILNLEYDERARVVLTFARYVERMDAWIIDGWREAPPP